MEGKRPSAETNKESDSFLQVARLGKHLKFGFILQSQSGDIALFVRFASCLYQLYDICCSSAPPSSSLHSDRHPLRHLHPTRTFDYFSYEIIITPSPKLTEVHYTTVPPLPPLFLNLSFPLCFCQCIVPVTSLFPYFPSQTLITATQL